MKLVFFSGGDFRENRTLNQSLVKLSNEKSPRLTYIPSSSYQSGIEFREVVRQFSKFGLKRFIHFPIDVPFSDALFLEAFNADIVYLGGGNTYNFLKCLKQKKLMSDLKYYVKQGGVLAGVSAGAIIMSPNISAAGFPSFDKDINYVKLKNLNSLRLTSFEFFPHYKNSKRYDKELLAVSKNMKNPLYACPDGAGIIVEDHKISFVGKVVAFIHGKKFSMLPNLKL